MATKKPAGLSEHPTPTEATFKQIYGTAFRCGKPDCREPLYRVNSATSATILNSNVAHIHARREGGPRWKPGMTSEENRHPNNLMPMCEPHAREIDVTPEHYPAGVLREWKRAQLAEFARTQRGWDLSDKQVHEVTSVVSALEHAVAELKTAMPFSPQQRPRREALNLAARRVRAARSARLRAVVSGSIEELMSKIAAAPESPLKAPPGKFRVLVAPMGAGKTEEAWRWFDEGLQEAFDDDAVDVPVWLEARQSVGGLERAVRDQLGKDPRSRCRVVINDLDRVDPHLARHLVAEARELVEVWQNLTVVATTQPGLNLAPEEIIEVEPWPPRRGVGLVASVLGSDPPWQIWNPETIELVQRPLTALALATRLAAGGDTDVSRFQLLHELPRTIIDSRRPTTANPAVWEELARLAILTLEAQGPVHTADFGNHAQAWQLTDTGLVVKNDDQLGFALPIFEQHFGAHAISTETFAIEHAASRTSFPTWRYAIATAVANSARTSGREELLHRLARANPAALSWVIDEVRFTDPRVATGTRDRAEPAPESLAPTKPGEGADACIAAGHRLRDAYQALLSGFGPSAAALATHRDGQLLRWGAALKGDCMILAEHRDQTTPPLSVLPDFEHPRDLRAFGWGCSQAFTYPSGEFGRWRWARARIQKNLDLAVRRRVLATSANSPLTGERTWFLSCCVTSTSGPRHDRQSITVDEIRQHLAPMLETVRHSVSSTWQRGRHSIKSADVRWLDKQLVSFEGGTIPRPWPSPNQPGPRNQWTSQGYSHPLAEELTALILAAAITGYLDLVQTNFPAFGSALGLYSILPVEIRGTITQPAQDEYGYSAGLNFAWYPIPNQPQNTEPKVELRSEIHPAQGPYWHQPSGGPPESPTAHHLPMLEDGDLPLGGHRPATNLAYEWLARDLHALGWLKQRVNFDGD